MFTSNQKKIALGIAAAVAIFLFAILLAPPNRATEETDLVSLVPDADAAVPAVPADEESAQVVETAPMPPVVDTLRVDADGEVLIAGRADPMAEVAVVVAGQEVARTAADASGGFVTFASLTPSAQTRSMILVVDPDGAAVKSEQSYFIAPIAAPAMEVAALEEPVSELSVSASEEPSVSEAVEETEQHDQAASAVEEDELPAATPNDAETPQEPATPTIIVADQDGVRVVQPAGAGPEVLDNVALDTITYDPTGEVQIAGRAQGDGFVTVYLDNQPITTSRIAEGGGWRTDLPDIDTGVYTLRVDEVDRKGTVVSRIETPFKREEPEVVAEVLSEQTDEPSFEVAMTTVQPGATLWAIAETRFGAGIRYVEVFEANRDRIKNPDLIYPGQVFRVPGADE